MGSAAMGSSVASSCIERDCTDRKEERGVRLGGEGGEVEQERVIVHWEKLPRHVLCLLCMGESSENPPLWFRKKWSHSMLSCRAPITQWVAPTHLLQSKQRRPLSLLVHPLRPHAHVSLCYCLHGLQRSFHVLSFYTLHHPLNSFPHTTGQLLHQGGTLSARGKRRGRERGMGMSISCLPGWFRSSVRLCLLAAATAAARSCRFSLCHG